MKKTLLFVTYGGGHVRMVCPVVHALRKSPAYASGDLAIRVLGLPAAKATLARNGIDSIGFRDYVDEQRDGEALAWGRALAKDHHSPTIGADLEDSVAYLGLCYRDLEVRLGREQAAEQFRRKARQAFLPLTVMERIFEDVKPDFVAATNSPRSEAAAIETADRRGIGTLIMTDLFTGMGDYPLKARDITFLNEIAREMFIDDGLVDEARSALHITGNPAFDPLLDLPSDRDPGWVKRHFPAAADKRLVLHADMPGYWHPEDRRSHLKSDAEIQEELDACYNAAMSNGAAYLIRPHPSQKRTVYEEWLRNHKNAHLAADCDLHELLAHTDLLVARTTTVALEAAYMGRRVLQLDAEFHTDFPLAKMGIAWGVSSYDSLPGEMKSALTDDKQREEKRSAATRTLPDGPAAPKIAGILLEKLRGA